MSLVVAEKTALASDDAHMSEGNKSPSDSSSMNATTSDADVARPNANDKDKDNEKGATDNPTAGSRELNEPPPSNAKTSNQTDLERGASSRRDSGLAEGALNDVSSPSPARRQSTTSRFKEKRPEPLKLNPNQEIPLDLSVKSAGNVPSGNIFNLANISGSTGPLDTPRIQWQDNDTLLSSAKGRLFPSSTSTSQRARLVSLVGDSPPITPNTPLIENMFSLSEAATMRSSRDMPHSASWALDSPFQSFSMSSPLEINKLQMLDKSIPSSNKPLINHHNSRAEPKGAPRRSCSTDNLNVNRANTLATGQNLDEAAKSSRANSSAKKSSVSPLATKNLTNRNGAIESGTKFPYTNQQIAINKSDAQKSPSSSSNSSINGCKSLTPTGLTNATANLLNIHLNSPNGHSSHGPVSPQSDADKQGQYKPMNQPSIEQEPSPLDPLLSAVSYCHHHHHHQQQQQQQRKSPFVSVPSSSNGPDHGHSGLGYFHQQHSSLGSSATLNTPTLISPSQLKAGHMCFLPSPTLSPMSSVFEMPSPFLMCPPSNAPLPQHHKGPSNVAATDAAKSPRNGLNRVADPSSAYSTQQDLRPTEGQGKNGGLRNSGAVSGVPSNSNPQASCSSSSNSSYELHRTRVDHLSQLITTAAQKGKLIRTNSAERDLDADVDMEIDGGVVNQSAQVGQNDCPQDDVQVGTANRPATVIPQICVSRLNERSRQTRAGDGGEHHELSLSPKSQWARANDLIEARHESSSAPPGVYQPHAKSKLKTIGADSCFNLSGKSNPPPNVQLNGIRGKPAACAPNNARASAHAGRASSKPYPVIRRLIAGSTQHLQDPASCQNSQCFLETRSNSAEPAVFLQATSSKVSQLTPASCHGSDVSNGQLYLRQNISCSVQHLPQAIKSEAQLLSDSYQQRRQDETSRASQARYQPQDLAYSQQQYYHHQPQAGALAHQEQLGYQQQQTSMSASELNRWPNIRQGYPPVVSSQLIVAASNDAISAHASQAQQIFQQNPQSIPLSPMNRFDNFPHYNGYQQQLGQQFRQSAPGPVAVAAAAASSASLLRLAESQTSTSHLLPNEASILRTTMSNPVAAGEQSHQLSAATGFANGGDPLCRQTAMLQCGYPLECESRSESRSSCSLDFGGPFSGGGGGGGGGGRADHLGGSNLVAKKYHCDHCSKSFTRSDMLTRHRRLHSGDRPFQCNECKQEFSRSDHLSTHMRTHTGEKPYKCKLCSYSACRKDMITRHLKVHNRNPHSMDPL